MMGRGKTSFEQLLSVMPTGWQENARESGALRRGREIKNAVDLLRLVFLYLTEGKSFNGTAALLKLGGIASMTKKAVFTRFQKCATWLQWLCENIYRNGKMIVKAPEWLGKRQVYLADASDEPVHGSDKADYRLHYLINLFNLDMKEMHLTKTDEGEKISNFKKLGKKDVVMGDRAYCSIQGIEYLQRQGCGFILRYGTKRFHLYSKNGRKVNLIRFFKGLKAGESTDVTLYYQYEGEYRPLRFCALRKTKEAEKDGLERLKKKHMKQHGNKTLSAAQIAYNRYVIVVTSIGEATAEQILELYRHRWQIELAFKRLKSLFGYNEIPVHVEESAKSWFYGKLLLAALCETWVNSGRFSPQATKQDA